MEESTYVTNSYIIQNNENYSPSLYFIIKGKAEIVYKNDNEQQQEFKISDIDQGQVLCDLHFFSGEAYPFSVKCKTFVEVYKIQRKSLMEILYQNKEDLEKFSLIKDNFLQNGQSKYYKRKCLICQKTTHNEVKCNLLNYKPKTYSINMKKAHQEREQKERIPYIRKDLSYFNARNRAVLEEIENVQYKIYQDEEFQTFADNIHTYTEFSSSARSFDDSQIQENNENAQKYPSDQQIQQMKQPQTPNNMIQRSQEEIHLSQKEIPGRVKKKIRTLKQETSNQLGTEIPERQIRSCFNNNIAINLNEKIEDVEVNKQFTYHSQQKIQKTPQEISANQPKQKGIMRKPSITCGVDIEDQNMQSEENNSNMNKGQTQNYNYHTNKIKQRARNSRKFSQISCQSISEEAHQPPTNNSNQCKFRRSICRGEKIDCSSSNTYKSPSLFCQSVRAPLSKGEQTPVQASQVFKDTEDNHSIKKKRQKNLNSNKYRKLSSKIESNLTQQASQNIFRQTSSQQRQQRSHSMTQNENNSIFDAHNNNIFEKGGNILDFRVDNIDFSQKIYKQFFIEFDKHMEWKIYYPRFNLFYQVKVYRQKQKKRKQSFLLSKAFI